jgi:hypothetical protein
LTRKGNALRRLNERSGCLDRGGRAALLGAGRGWLGGLDGFAGRGRAAGYNPHRRKVPRGSPITAFEANSGQIVRVENRAGNVHDGKASRGFLKALFEQLCTSLPQRHLLEMRMDAAFFRADVLDLLEVEGVEYALKVPFYPWLGLKQHIVKQRRWARIDDSACFEQRLSIQARGRSMRVVVYRKKVSHSPAKNFQLDLFDSNDGHYEYSAVVTNKTLTGRTLWPFMCGRGTHEKVYGELKSGFAFDCVPIQRFEANSAWQVMSIMAFNLMRGLQTSTTASSVHRIISVVRDIDWSCST